MRNNYSFFLKETENFMPKLLNWGKKFSESCLLFSNQSKNKLPVEYRNFDLIFGVGVEKECHGTELSLQKLKKWHSSCRDWAFGYLSYDLKNEIENLQSKNKDPFNHYQLHFFIPKHIFLLNKDKLIIKTQSDKKTAKKIILEIKSTETESKQDVKVEIKKTESKKQYLEKIRLIKEHIQRGDIYEMNYCQTFFSEKAIFSPEQIFLQLNQKSKSPFSCLLHLNDTYVISSSPERFIKKSNNQILSQPIKGTRKRGKNKEEDKKLKSELRFSEKDITENIMIADLVRNDLSRTAKKGSVRIDELCGIYTFEQVFQMITTVRSEIDPNLHFTEVLKTTFPMGSMTGVPKIRAMELIEKYETNKRGIFSGSIGYINPRGDIDFNVVIRSIIYNKRKKYLSISAGGAITSQSIPEEEYKESLLKAKALFEILNYKVYEE